MWSNPAGQHFTGSRQGSLTNNSPMHNLPQLMTFFDSNSDGRITFQELVEVGSGAALSLALKLRTVVSV